MTCAAIDTDGSLLIQGQQLVFAEARWTIAPGGQVFVSLDPGYRAAGWAAGDDPELYCNPVGSCVLATMGAPWRPYRGLVLITGYASVPESLPSAIMSAVEDVHAEVVAVLGGPPSGRVAPWATKEWRRDMRILAGEARVGELPELAVRTAAVNAATGRYSAKR
jgi:hypothetical protein